MIIWLISSGNETNFIIELAGVMACRGDRRYCMLELLHKYHLDPSMCYELRHDYVQCSLITTGDRKTCDIDAP